MCKYISKRNKIFIILGVVAVMVVAAGLGMIFLKNKGWYNFFSGVQWNNPYSVRTGNPFEGLRLNPFK